MQISIAMPMISDLSALLNFRVVLGPSPGGISFPAAVTAKNNYPLVTPLTYVA